MRVVSKILVFILLAVSFGTNAQQLSTPNLTCVSVLPFGAAEITWEQIPDPNGVFVRYDVYSASGALITGINNINTTTHVHAGAGADLSSQGFFVIAVASSAPFTSEPSDTVYSMFLNLINPANGQAILSWNAMHNPNIPNASAYQIYREYPTGVWTLVGTTPYGTESFIDTIDICSANINYKIVVDNLTCSSESNIEGGFFQDLIPPDSPIINSVSVDTANGGVIIDWNASNSADTDGYIIMTFLAGPGWTAIDTVFGINNTSYADGSSNPQNGYEIYGIVAFDSCVGASGSPNVSPLGIYHRTIFTSYEKIICDYGVKLTWTSYINWLTGVNHYEVFGSEGGGPFVSFGISSDTTLDVIGLTPGMDYCFVIRAVSNNSQSAISNIVCYNVYEPITPTFGYLATATVVNEEIELHYFSDVTGAPQAVKFSRSTSLTGPFSDIATVPIAGANTFYTDRSADPHSRSYYYRATAIDSCGNESVISNIAKTMYLTVESDNYTLDNLLDWNFYEDWDGNVIEYHIYRSLNGVFDINPIATVLPGGLVYTDNVNDYLETNGEICYYVEAVESPNSYGFNEVSWSNVVCAEMESMMWIPNAIIVGGINNEFKPVWSFIDIDNYKMEIRNRWGKIAFETTDPFQGWDGSHAGITDSEVFVYVITFKTSSGLDVVRRGRVTVIQ